jgi:hypothetical protein
MNEQKETNIEDNSKKIELLDSQLIKALVASISVYFISISFFSLILGNTIGQFITYPLSTISLFITARWDRQRESKEISLQNITNFIKSTKIDFWNISSGIIVISFVQLLSSLIIFFLVDKITPHYFDYISEDAGYFDLMIRLSDSWLGFAIIYFIFYSSYFVGGYFSARLAVRKNLSPYKHTILTAFSYTFLSLVLTILLYFIDKGELFLSSDGDDISIGATVLLYSQFILIPLIGARIAVGKSKVKQIENVEKDKEDFASLVSSEIKRLKTETNIKKSKPISNKRRKKFH